MVEEEEGLLDERKKLRDGALTKQHELGAVDVAVRARDSRQRVPAARPGRLVASARGEHARTRDRRQQFPSCLDLHRDAFSDCSLSLYISVGACVRVVCVCVSIACVCVVYTRVCALKRM